MKMKISSGVCYVKYYFSKIDNFISWGVCGKKFYFGWIIFFDIWWNILVFYF